MCYCVLCGRDAAKRARKISYHKFSKDVVQREMWLKFCKLNELDITSTTMFCNKYFKEEDFLIRAGDNNKLLKTGALPSIRKERLGRNISVVDSSDASDETNKELMLLAKTETNIDISSEFITAKDIERPIRYPGDINLSHLETPEKAVIAVNLTKKTIFDQRRKIRTLQQTCNRYKQKISCLKNLVEQLKRNKIISESAAKILMVLPCILFFIS